MQPFRSNNALAALSLEMGPIQSVEVAGSLSTTRFDATSESDLVSNFRSEGLLARYLLAIGPNNRLFLAADWQSASQNRTVVNIEPTDYRTRSVGLGMRRGAEPGLTSELRVSYAVVDFPDEEGEPFRGITAEGNLGLPAGGHGARGAEAEARAADLLLQYELFLPQRDDGDRLQPGDRSAPPDADERGWPDTIPIPSRSVSGHLRTRRSTIESGRNPGRYAYLVPSEGTRRRDHLRGGAVRLVYHVGRAMDLQLEYRRDRARSNIVAESAGVQYKIFDYDYESLTTSLIVGWQ